MKKFGIEPNERGQFEFADIIFHADDMERENKIYWLKECVDAGDDTQLERIKELEKQNDKHSKSKNQLFR